MSESKKRLKGWVDDRADRRADRAREKGREDPKGSRASQSAAVHHLVRTCLQYDLLCSFPVGTLPEPPGDVLGAGLPPLDGKLELLVPLE